MQTRTLGTGGLSVSAIGLGVMGMSEFYGKPDEAENEATLARAVEIGVTFWDTADAYGSGHNETMIGRFLAARGWRTKIALATKFGFVREGGRAVGVSGKPEYVREACDASLKQLGIETIDLYYLHRIDPEVPIEETVGAMAKLVEAGKVRYLGLSEAGPNSLRRASRIHPITALQTEYSLWARDVEDKILPACRELGIGFVAYSPLGRGLLTGNIRKIDDIAPHDQRRRQPRFKPGNFEKNLALLKPLEAIAAGRGVKPAQVALAWLLSRGEDVVQIPGTKQRKWLEQNVAAVDLQLDPKEIETLSSAFRPGARAGDRYEPGYFVTLGA